MPPYPPLQNSGQSSEMVEAGSESDALWQQKTLATTKLGTESVASFIWELESILQTIS